jgi:hypothetical protein
MRYFSQEEQAQIDLLQEGTPLPPGSFNRHTPAGFIAQRVSQVTCDGKFVEYQVGGNEALSKPLTTNADALLTEFTRLVKAGDIVRFVERWGPLGLCADHDLPHEHNKGPVVPRASGDSTVRWPVQADAIQGCPAPSWRGIGATCRESADSYLRFAAQGRGILLAASALRKGMQPTNEMWKSATVGLDRSAVAESAPELLLHRRVVHRIFTGEVAPYENVDDLGRQRWWWVVLGTQANDWLAISGVHPRIEMWMVDPQIRFMTSPVGIGLFGTIAMQLLRAVTGHMAPEICDGCGEPYLPAKRRPKRGQKHWCPDCKKKGVPTREWRAAKRAEKENGNDE